MILQPVAPLLMIKTLLPESCSSYVLLQSGGTGINLNE